MLAYSDVTPILHSLHVNNLNKKEIIDFGVTLALKPLFFPPKLKEIIKYAFQFKKSKVKKKKKT